MVRHGDAPFLECSSKGDRRFSAFHARIRSRGNRSIEEIYQAAKIFEDGTTGLGWREAKGRCAVNIDEVRALYSLLWDEYIAENPGLSSVLMAANGLSDVFGQVGSACQATELWRIRSERSGIRLVVTGGRDYCDTARIFAALDELHSRRPVSVLIEGEARGLDVRAKAWAKRRGIAVEAFEPDWDELGKAAGHIRNQQMIDDGKPDFGMVFPGGRGTTDMRRRLVEAGIPFEEAA